MEDLRVIDNLKQDRLREDDVVKEEKKRQKEAARAAKSGQGVGAPGWW